MAKKTSLQTIILLLVVLLLPSCRRESWSEGRAAQEPIAVETLKVSSREGENASSSSHYIGTTEAVREAVVTSRHSGTLATLQVRRGEKVSAGQTLAEVESQSLRSSLEMAEASLKQAEDAYARASKVHSDGGVADVKMVEIETKLSQSKAAVAAARQSLEECTLKAPFGGFAAEVYVSGEGESVSAVQRIVKIVDPERIEVRFAVPESEIGSIRKGEKATIEVAAIGDGAVFSGTIESLGVSASPLSHSYDCTASVSQTTSGSSGRRLLLPGMVCKVRLNAVSNSEGAGFTVPAEAVQTGESGRYVWIAGADGVVEKRIVKIGGFAGGRGVIVTEGLSEGEEVIVKGFRKVSSGMKVSRTQVSTDL